MTYICEEKTNDLFVSAVIVSAGSSSRMGGINKQFLEFGGMPVIAHSVKVFQENSSIAEIVVVTRETDIPQIEKLVEKFGFSKVSSIVVGGATRQKSVLKGIEACSPCATHIAVHDGARPLVTDKIINDTLSVAVKTGAAATGVKVVDTIKCVNNRNEILSTPERDTLRAVHTPQIFSKKLYLDAARSVQDSDSFTDDCKLIEASGNTVTIVEGDYQNIKITTPADFCIAEAFFKKRGK